MSAKSLNVGGLRLDSIVEVQEPIYSNTCLGNDRNNPILITTKELQPHTVLPNNEHWIPIISNPNSTAIFNFRLRQEKVLLIQTQKFYPRRVLAFCVIDAKQKSTEYVLAFRKVLYLHGQYKLNSLPKTKPMKASINCWMAQQCKINVLPMQTNIQTIANEHTSLS